MSAWAEHRESRLAAALGIRVRDVPLSKPSFRYACSRCTLPTDLLASGGRCFPCDRLVRDGLTFLTLVGDPYAVSR